MSTQSTENTAAEEKPRRGCLIVFEGGEGSGKTTQLERSHIWLLNSPLGQRLLTSGLVSKVITTREPGGTDLGIGMRQLLLHQKTTQPMHNRAELLLFAADRAQHVEELLKPALKAGAIILCDRYTDSTVSYQGYGRGMDLALIDQLNQAATDGLASDLTLWLDVEVETGLKRANRRGASDRIEQSNLDFHHRVRQGFLTLASSQPQRMVRIDANRSTDEVSQEIQTVLQDALERQYGITSDVPKPL